MQRVELSATSEDVNGKLMGVWVQAQAAPPFLEELLGPIKEWPQHLRANTLHNNTDQLPSVNALHFLSNANQHTCQVPGSSAQHTCQMLFQGRQTAWHDPLDNRGQCQRFAGAKVVQARHHWSVAWTRSTTHHIAHTVPPLCCAVSMVVLPY